MNFKLIRRFFLIAQAIVGLLAVAVAVLAYNLPETKDVAMLTTVEETVDFYQGGLRKISLLLAKPNEKKEDM